MLIGYARVSTNDQNLELQVDALKAAGCEEVLTEIVSGAKKPRPVLDKALGKMRKGDVLVVWKLDRLGRSLSHLVTLAEKLQTKEIGFKSLSHKGDLCLIFSHHWQSLSGN